MAVRWSFRTRLTTWYGAIVVVMVVAGATAVAMVEWRLSLRRLDGELARLLLTLKG